MEKKLYRDEYRKKIGGVCAGLAEYFDMDVAIIRALFLLTFIFMGTGLMAYIVLWIVLPKKGINFYNPNVDYRVPPEQQYNPNVDYRVPPEQQYTPFEGVPPPKSSSTAGVIFGCILIFFGASFLLHELHVFYFWHVAKLWPAILIVVGLAVIVSGQKKQPWETYFQSANKEPEVKTSDESLNTEEKKDDNFTDTPPTI